MRPKALASVALGLLALAGITWVLLPSDSARKPGHVVIEAESGQSDSSPKGEGEPFEVDAESATKPALERSEDLDPAARTSATEGKAIHGFIHDEGGAPISGAMVTWTPLRLAAKGGLVSSTPATGVAKATVLAQSSSTGAFVIPLPEEYEEAVLWVSHPSYLAHRTALSNTQGPESLAITLERSQALRVRVVDEADRLVAGAVIQQRGAQNWTVPQADSTMESAKELFVREVIADAKGQALLPSFPGTVTVQATLGNQASASVRVAPDSPETTLHIASSWTLSGRVRGLLPSQSATCSVYFDAPSHTEALADLPVLTDGIIPESILPRRNGGSYRIQIEGAGLAATVKRFDSDTVGDHLAVELTLAKSLPLDVTFLTPSGDPAASVQARALWYDGTAYFGTGMLSSSDEHGQLQLLSPTSSIDVEYSHPDYLDSKLNGIVLAEDGENHIEITLQPFGRITGVVLAAGNPLPTYRLHYYDTHNNSPIQTLEVQDQEDGRFTIDEAPLGSIELFALADGEPQSSFAFVDVEQGATQDVTLEIPTNALGIGRVIDAMTGAPLTNCNVDRYLHQANGVGLSLAFETHGTDPDGRFSFPGFGAQLEQIWVTCDGFAGVVGQAERGPDGKFDFGQLRLGRTSTLTLEFTGRSEFAGYTYEVIGAHNQTPLPIPSSGRVELQGTLPNNGNVLVTTPTGGSYNFGFSLVTQGPWTFEVPLGGQGKIKVLVVGLDSIELENCTLQIEPTSFVENEQRTTLNEPLPADEVHLQSLPLGEAAIRLIGPAGVLASVGVQCTTEEQTITLDASLPIQAFRIVTADRAPIAGAQWICYRNGLRRYIDWGTSGTDGVCTVHGAPPDHEYMVLVTDSNGAHSTGIAAALGSLERPTEVVFDPSASLSLFAVDRGTPLDGVMLSLRDATTGAFLGWPTTDAKGRADFSNITEGEVLISPHSTSIWYETLKVSTTTTTTLQTLELRRVGALVVHVLNAYGEPQPAAWLDITSDEFGVGVADWLSANRAASPTGLTTNEDGLVRIEGLPNGSYTIEAAGESITVQVPPAGEVQAELKLKP